jgi:hypothetical protein
LVASLLVVATFAQPLAQNVAHDVFLTRQDTRTLAKNWIETNIPAKCENRCGMADAGATSPAPERLMRGSNEVRAVTVVGGARLLRIYRIYRQNDPAARSC